MKFCLQIEEHWRPLFDACGLVTAGDFIGLHTGDIRSRKQGRTVSMRRIGSGASAKDFFIKTHALEGFFFSGPRSSPALREAKNIARLNDLGIRTPRVAAVGVTWSTRRLEDVLVTERVDGTPLEELLGDPGTVRRLVAPAARFAAAVHRLGVIHRDFYCGHIFVSEHAPAPRFILMDLERLLFTKIIRDRWRVKDLASLAFTADPVGWFTKLRFYALYCREADIGRPGRRALLRKVRRKLARIGRHTARVMRKGGWT